jgi:hypothetical protein
MARDQFLAVGAMSRNTAATAALAITLGIAPGAHAEPPCNPGDPNALVNFGVEANVYPAPFYSIAIDRLFNNDLCTIDKTSNWTLVLYKRNGSIYSGWVSNKDISDYSSLARFNNRWLGGVNW